MQGQVCELQFIRLYQRGHKPNKRTWKGSLAYQHFALKIVLLFKCRHHCAVSLLAITCGNHLKNKNTAPGMNCLEIAPIKIQPETYGSDLGTSVLCSHVLSVCFIFTISHNILAYSCARHEQISKGGWSGPESFKGTDVSLTYNWPLWKRSGGNHHLWIQDTWCWMDGWSVLFVVTILGFPWFLLFFTCNAHRTPLKESCMYTRMYIT